MPNSEVWPYDASSITEKGINFKPMTMTVCEWFPMAEGVSQAGNNYHIPPRLSFEEDPERNEWQWKQWNDVTGRFEDFPGPFPLAGDIVQVKLKATPRTESGYFYDIVSCSSTGQSNPAVAAAQPAAQPTQAPQAPAGGGGGPQSPLGRIPVEQRIAAVAMTNVMVLEVWQQTPDGDPWKETIREAVKKVSLAQVPPSLLGQAQTLAKENVPAEVPPEQDTQRQAPPPPPAPAPPQAQQPEPPKEDVVDLPW